MMRLLILGSLGALLAGLLLASSLQVSCATAGVQAEVKVDPRKLRGSWELSSIDYDKSYRIRPFDEGVEIACFVGSVWNFVPNNGKASYHLFGDSGCPPVSSDVVFNAKADGQFSFKKVPAGAKSKEITSGYFLRLENQTDTGFDLLQHLPSGSVTDLRVVYHFKKLD